MRETSKVRVGNRTRDICLCFGSWPIHGALIYHDEGGR